MTTETKTPAAAASQAPAGKSIDEILADPAVAKVGSEMRPFILEAKEFAGEITLTIKRDKIREVCQAFKADSYTYLVDLAGIDYSKYPNHKAERFGVAYHLYSFEKNVRIRLKLTVGDGEYVPTVSNVWKTANWMEREAFDMFGILFYQHPNLERILMWEGFNGYPLRKDFPIRGIDTGARIYPEVFPEGGGPKAGSTGKPVADVNIWTGGPVPYGRTPVGAAPKAVAAAVLEAPAEEAAPVATATAAPAAPGASAAAPFHSGDLSLPERMELAKSGDLKTKLFAAMAQTDCAACGYDCEGYADALAKGETEDVTLCVPGEKETEQTLRLLLHTSGKKHN